MSLSATLFGRDSAIFKATNILGLGIPGFLDKKFGAKDVEIEGPRLSDLSVQTSTYGAPIPRLYGTIAVMGNLIWLENNKLKETVRKKKSGGKGGGGSSEPTKTYSYSATFHIALCEGPIAGIRRMWCGDKLLYNAGSDDLETIIASNKAAKGWKLYFGTDSQLPDSRYEANVGAGNASGHRGIAYLAFYDFQLADYSNTLQGAQFKVEVVSVATDRVPVEYATHNTPVAVGNSGLCIPPNETGILVSFAYPSASEAMFKESLFTIGGAETIGFGPGYQPGTPPYKWYRSHWVIGGRSPIYSNFGGTLWYYGGAEIALAAYTAGSDEWTVIDWGGTLYFKSRADSRILRQDGLLVSVSGAYSLTYYSGGLATINSSGNSVKLLDQDLNVISTISLSNPLLNIDGWAVAVSDSEIFAVRLDQLLRFNIDGSFIDQYMIQTTGISTFPPSMVIDNGVLAIQKDPLGCMFFDIGQISASMPTLGYVVSAECVISGFITDSDIDTSLLTNDVRGYRVNGGSIRSAIEPLQTAFPFDIRTHGYVIQFLPRGQASIATIPWSDLGVADGGQSGEILKFTREMDSQLSARTSIKYLDAEREYAISEQYSERLNTGAVNKVERELPLVLTANEAAGAAEVLNFLPWMERLDAAFILPPTYRHLEAGDVVTLIGPEATYELRLTENNEAQDGRPECKARPSRAAIYQSSATGGEGVLVAGSVGLGGSSIALLLDIPVVDEVSQNAVGFVGVMTGLSDGWPGGLLVRSSDGGQTWSDLQAYAGKGSFGTALGLLPASSCTLLDQRTISVGMISGAPESITRDQMLAGANYAAYGVDGRWEIVRFQNAILQADGSYLISGFVRGERGTEWATGLHVAGDYFVLLDDTDNAFIGSPVETIGLPRTYRAVTAGDSVDQATDFEFTYRGVNLDCLSPVYAKGSRDGSSNFTGTFTRRSRLSSSWWNAGVQAPVGETTESYEIDVMSGSTVKRTIAVTSPSFAYSAANQTTDFGSAQSSITFRIYQLSELVGRGYPLEITL